MYETKLYEAIQAYNHGVLPHIGGGTTRHVYGFENYVLKVGCSEVNHAEYMRYEYQVAIGEEEDFATVFAYKGNFLLMEKVNAPFDYDAHDMWRDGELTVSNDIVRILDYIEDTCLFNVGIRFSTDRFVLLDFAT